MPPVGMIVWAVVGVAMLVTAASMLDWLLKNPLALILVLGALAALFYFKVMRRGRL